MSTHYRPDVDGLRAVAVLAVVIFHAWPEALPGGFVGVDVFFVISGFLITRIILAERAAGQFSLAHFWARRARRLLPALFTMLLVTSVACVALLWPSDLADYGRSLAWTVAYLSNVFFAGDVSYFGPDADLKPLLHTWSLGVEEQFYLVYPLLIAAASRGRASVPVAFLVAVLVLSFGLCAYLTYATESTKAFYSLPSRMWELLVGGVLARLGPPSVPRPGLVRGAGLALILVAVATLSEKIAFPGLAAVLPVAGAALVILAGPPAQPTLLAARPLVYVGLMSYSLYLWHWPVVALFRHRFGQDLEPLVAAAAVLLSFGLGSASLHLVERPLRYGAARPAPRIAAAVVLSLAMIGFGRMVDTRDGLPGRLGTEALAYHQMTLKEQYFALYDRGGCFIDYDQRTRDYDVARCWPVAAPGRPAVLVWGDSYAASLWPGLRRAFEGRATVGQYTATGCRPMRGGGQRCDEFYERFLRQLEAGPPPDAIVMAGNWYARARKYGLDRVLAELDASLARLGPLRSRVLLVGQTPVFARKVPLLMYEQRAAPGEATLRAIDAGGLNARIRELAERHRTAWFDPYTTCVAGACVAGAAGEPYFWDVGHMTGAGSAYFAAPLRRAIDAMLTSP